MKLNLLATGISLGAVAGLYFAGAALLGWAFPPYGEGFISAVSTIYLGFYKATPGGALMGLLFGFADAFICGIILAWVYNRISGAKK